MAEEHIWGNLVGPAQRNPYDRMFKPANKAKGELCVPQPKDEILILLKYRALLARIHTSFIGARFTEHKQGLFESKSEDS